MAFRLQQSTASQIVMLKAYLSSDHVSPATSKTIAIKISKNGGGFGDPQTGATNASEVSNGWYSVTLGSTDTATVGPLVVRGTCSGVDDVELICFVEAAVTVDNTAIADAVLNRDLAAGSDTNSRSLRNAIRLLRNKWAVASGTLTVYKEDDSTTAWTGAVGSAAGATPVTTVDPA